MEDQNAPSLTDTVLQDRLEREARAHDGERRAHAAIMAGLSRLRAERAALEKRCAALARKLDTARKRPRRKWRLRLSLRGFRARHPILVARLRAMRQLLRTAAGLAGGTASRRPADRPPLQATPGASVPSLKLAPANIAAIGDPLFRLFPIASPPTGTFRPTPARRMICVSPLLPYPLRAGNSYRIGRMLAWLAGQGWNVLLVVCPPSAEEPTEHEIVEAVALFPNLIVCRRDGALVHHLARCDVALEALAHRRPRSFASALGEADRRDAGSARRLELQRAFCPDVLVELLLHLEAHFEPEILLAEYAFMTRAFALFGPKLRKVVDTIDVFSNKSSKVEQFGIQDIFALTPGEEASLLGRADLLIAIQPEEAADLRRLVPTVPVVTVGVDFDVADAAPEPAVGPVVLLVASDNPANAKGLIDFIRFAWPLIRREIPQAQLHVVGAIGETAEIASPGIHLLGRVADLGPAYAQARVVINPSVAGTGLKIKTVEALCHFRPIVLWPSGVEGLAADAREGCHIAGDWFEFARHVARLLQSSESREGAQRRQELLRHYSPDRVYAPLAEALNAHG